MATTQTAGVTLVAEGVDSFIAQLTAATQALKELTDGLSKTSSVLAQFSTGGANFDALAKGSGKASKNLTELGNATGTTAERMIAINGVQQDFNRFMGGTASSTAEATYSITEFGKSYVVATGNVASSTGKASNSLASLGAATQQVSRVQSIAATTTQRLRDFVSGLSTVVSSAKGQFSNFLKTLEENSAELTRFGLALTAAGAAGQALVLSAGMTASRIEELDAILEVTRKNTVGLAESQLDFARSSALSREAVKGEVQEVRDLHLTGQVATQTVAQLIRYNLDWTRASELARLAQDAATFAMQDSSKATEGLINGIITLQPRVLRTYGLLINLEVAYERWAQANNRAVDSMTVAERQAAAFNEVLSQAPQIAGAYEAAMGTASKQMRSLKTDFLNVAEAMGESFTPVLDAGIGSFRSFLNAVVESPDPMRAFATYAVAAGSALATLVGTIAIAIPRVLALNTAIKAFTGLSLGTISVIGALVGAVASIVGASIAAETAHREEALAILEGAKTYNDYISKLDAAKLSVYELTESLYGLVKAQEETNQAAYAEELSKTYLALKRFTAGFAESPAIIAELKNAVDASSVSLSDMELAVLSDYRAVLEIGTAWGKSGDELIAWTKDINASARAVVLARAETENYNRFEQQRYDILRKTMGATNDSTKANIVLSKSAQETRDKFIALGYAFEEATMMAYNLNRSIAMTGNVLSIAQEEAEKSRVALKGLAQAEADYAAAMDEATDKAADDMIAADERATEARRDAAQSLHDDLIDLNQDYSDKVSEILESLAQVDIDLQADLLAAQQENLLEREDAWREYQQSLAEAEAEFQQDMADLATERQQDIEDANREYAQDRSDLLKELNRDLEDLERDHTANMLAIDKDYYEELAELAEEYGQKVADINEKYARERQDILDKYSLEPEEPDLDEQREALQKELKEVEEAWKEGTMTYWQYAVRREEILAELEKLKEEELAALDERKQAELDELVKWLEEEEKARQEAYETAKANEESRYTEQRAEKQRKYEQDLSDLQEAHQREVDEINRDFERKQQALVDAHAREKAEIDRRYQERLAALDAQLATEQAKLAAAAEADKARLQAQLEDERENYAEREKELRDHYGRQIAQIDTDLASEKNKIHDALEKEKLDIIAMTAEQNAAFASAYQTQRNDLENHLFGPGGMLEKWRYYKQQLEAEFLVGSPAKWFIDFGKSQVEGFKQGADFDTALGGILDQFGLLQHGLSSLIPQTAYVPYAGRQTGPSTTSNNLSVTANYTRPQSEASLRDDLANYAMMMGMRQ